MKLTLRIILTLALVAALALPASALELQDHIDQIQKNLTEESITDMMDVAKLIEKSGASYQEALTVSPGLASNFKPGDELRVMIGFYQFDSLYAAAFGKKEQAAKAMEAQNTLLTTMNLSGQTDISAVFPPEINWMIREPENANIDDVIAAYAAQADKYSEMMKTPESFDTMECAMYGFVLQGLYVATQTAVQTGMDPAAVEIIADMKGNIEQLLMIYDSFRTEADHYAKFVSPDGFMELWERTGWLRPLAVLIADRDGKLTEAEIKALAEFVTKERREILTGE